MFYNGLKSEKDDQSDYLDSSYLNILENVDYKSMATIDTPEVNISAVEFPEKIKQYVSIFQAKEYLPRYRADFYDFPHQKEEIILYSQIIVSFEETLVFMGLEESEVRNFVGELIIAICDSDKSHIYWAYLNNHRVDLIADLLVNVVISSRIIKEIPYLFFLRSLSKGLLGEERHSKKAENYYSIRDLTSLPAFGENLVNTLGQKLTGIVEEVTGTDISPKLMQSLAESRYKNLIVKKNWLPGTPSKELLYDIRIWASEYLRKILDIDNADAAALCRHYIFRIFGKSVSTESLATARAIETRPIIPLGRNAHLNGSDPALTTISSMPFSPFSGGLEGGTHIATDVRNVAKKQPESLANYLNTQGYNVASEGIIDFLVSCGFTFDEDEYENLNDMVVKAIYSYKSGAIQNKILGKFVDKLTTADPVVLLERLTPITLKNSNELVDDSITAYASIMFAMLEIAIDQLNRGNEVWLVQCDASFNASLYHLFGENNFYQFKNREGKGITQIRRDKRDKSKVRVDICNTVVLDLEASLVWLLQHEPGTSYYETGMYVFNSLNEDCARRIKAMLANENKSLFTLVEA